MSKVPDTIDELLTMWGEPPKHQLTGLEKICQEKQYEASKQKPNKDFDLELAEKTGQYLCPKHKVLYSIKETCPKCIALWQTGMANQTDPDILDLTDDDYMEL